MSNQKLTEVKNTDLLDDVVEIATLGLISAPVTTSYVVENTDNGNRNEFASKGDAIKFMSANS